MADIFAVIADPTRRELLRQLREAHTEEGLSPNADRAERSVSELVAATGLSQPTVSKHLKVLREHDLVSVREESQHRFYSLHPGPLAEIAEWVAPFALHGAVEFADLRDDSVSFIAWSGASLGETIGRRVAESTHQARTVIDDAREQVTHAVQAAGDQVAKVLPKRPPSA